MWYLSRVNQSRLGVIAPITNADIGVFKNSMSFITIFSLKKQSQVFNEILLLLYSVIVFVLNYTRKDFTFTLILNIEILYTLYITIRISGGCQQFLKSTEAS